MNQPFEPWFAADGWSVRVAKPAGPRSRPGVCTPRMDDAALVAASVAGEREAFDVIVERHRRAVYQVCIAS